MSDKNKELHPMDYPYPLIIVKDRYYGTYTGGGFLAFNLESYQVPDDELNDEDPFSRFWLETNLYIGRGRNPMDAIFDLKEQLDHEDLIEEFKDNTLDESTLYAYQCLKEKNYNLEDALDYYKEVKEKGGFKILL